MSDWTEGYVTDLDYPYHYQPELNPLRTQLTFLNAGLMPRVTANACELGFGQGISANLHAAASTTQWFSTDFNPAQTGFAMEMAAASGAKAEFSDQSFAEFCTRCDLPDFDFIGMHGVWSWISDDNRRVIVDFVRRKLKIGGVFYVSYNLQPGFAAIIPVRELLLRHVESMGRPGQGLGSRIDGTLAFAAKLLALCPNYTKAHPQIEGRLKSIGNEDRRYLAHEYFNRDWLPSSFSRVAEWLAPAKLDYACSASHFNAGDTWYLSAEQRALVKDIVDPRLRETVHDFMANQSFRMDYWAKGVRRLEPIEKLESLLKQRIILVRQRTEVPLKIVTSLGEFELLESVCEPILDSLADHQPKTLGQIGQAVKDKRVSLPQILHVVTSYIKTGAMAPVQDEAVICGARKQTDKLNAWLCDQARSHAHIGVLASPVIGAGVPDVDGRVGQLFLHAISQGKGQPAQMAEHVSQILQLQTMTEGKPPDPTADNRDALLARAKSFTEKRLPILKALQIA